MTRQYDSRLVPPREVAGKRPQAPESSKIGLSLRLGAVGLLALYLGLSAQGCASTSEEEPSADTSCSRLKVAAKMSMIGFRIIPEVQGKAIDECAELHMAACVSVPVATPFTAAFGTVFAPFGFLLGMTFADDFQAVCS